MEIGRNIIQVYKRGEKKQEQNYARVEKKQEQIYIKKDEETMNVRGKLSEKKTMNFNKYRNNENLWIEK